MNYSLYITTIYNISGWMTYICCWAGNIINFEKERKGNIFMILK